MWDQERERTKGGEREKRKEQDNIEKKFQVANDD